jgi:hypothetical protein
MKPGAVPSGRASAKEASQMRAHLADLGDSVGREKKKDGGGKTEHRMERIPKPSETNESSGSAARRDPTSRAPTPGGSWTGRRVARSRGNNAGVGRSAREKGFERESHDHGDIELSGGNPASRHGNDGDVDGSRGGGGA